MNSPYTTQKIKRFIAYILDIIIISVLVVGVSKIDNLHPKHKEYYESLEVLNKMIEETSNTGKLNDEQTKEYEEVVYNASKYQASYMFSELVIVISYFTLFPLCNNGMTVGKRLMKLKVVNNDEDNSKAKFWQHLLKAAFCPIALSSLLRNSFTYIIILGGLLIFKTPMVYLRVANLGSMAITVICYIDIFRMILKEDSRGLSDTLARVKVIDYVRD